MWEVFPLTLAQDDAAPAVPAAAPGAAAAPGGGNTTNTTTAPGGLATPVGGTPPPNPFGGNMMLIFLAVLVGMILVQVMTGRKDRKKREKILAAMKKGDRVKTIGGVYGSVMDLRDQMVLLKVDENNNTRIWYDRSAVQNVVEEKA